MGRKNTAGNKSNTPNTANATPRDEFGFPVSYDENAIHVDGATTPVTESATMSTHTDNEFSLTDNTQGGTITPTAPETNGTPIVADATPAAGGKKRKAPNKNGNGTAGRTAASVPGALMGVKEPVGEDKDIPLLDLAFSDRVQMRTQQFDPQTVDRYKLLMLDNPDALPPIRVIEIAEADRELNKLSSRLIVWDGFQRGEARRAAYNESTGNRKATYRNIKCNVSQGTFEQAVRLSLRANAAHGLPRSFADMRKAMDRLIKDSEMLSKVMAEGVGQGGGTVAIANAIGTSHGFVDKMLKDVYKLKVSRDKLVPLPKDEQGGTSAPAGPTRSDPKGGIRKESLEAIKSKTDTVIAEELAWYADAMQRRYEVLRTREHAAPLLKEAAAKIGIPFETGTTRAGDLDPKAANPDEMIKVEYWPAVDSLRTVCDEFKRNLDSMSTPHTPNPPHTGRAIHVDGAAGFFGS